MDNKPPGADQDSNAPYNQPEPEIRGSCEVCNADVFVGEYCVRTSSEHLICQECAEEIHDLYEHLP